jgi:hypothetical protein
MKADFQNSSATSRRRQQHLGEGCSDERPTILRRSLGRFVLGTPVSTILDTAQGGVSRSLIPTPPLAWGKGMTGLLMIVLIVVALWVGVEC